MNQLNRGQFALEALLVLSAYAAFLAVLLAASVSFTATERAALAPTPALSCFAANASPALAARTRFPISPDCAFGVGGEARVGAEEAFAS